MNREEEEMVAGGFRSVSALSTHRSRRRKLFGCILAIAPVAGE